MSQQVAPVPGKPAHRRSIVRAVTETLESRRLFAAPTVTEPQTRLHEEWMPLNDGHFEFQAGPQRLDVEFDQSVTVANNALLLTNLTTGTPYTDVAPTAVGNTHTWTVTGADNQGVAGGPLITGALPRGNYELLIKDTAVTNAAGDTLDGNTYVPDNGNPDGESGDDYVSSFFVVPGDTDRSRTVDGADFGMYDNSVHFPNTTGYMNADFNYDGQVTTADYAILERWANTALPAPPTQANTLTAAAGRGFVDLYWTAPADTEVDGFGIYRSLDAGDTWALYHSVTDPTARSWRDNGANGQGLDDGTKYTYRIRAYTETGDPAAPRSYAVTSNKYWTVTNLPGPLDAPVVSDVAHDALTLTWNDNTTNESGFRIEVTGPGGATSTVLVPARAGEGQTSFRVTGLTPESAYSFRVQAYVTGTQDSAWSLSTGATTLAIGSPDTPVLVAPTGLTATLAGDAQVQLDWADTPNETGYVVYYAEEGQPFALWVHRGANENSYFGTLKPFTTYAFQVEAVNAQGSSARSNTATLTTRGTLYAPTGLTADALADDRVSLVWNDMSSHETAFEIQRKEGADGAWETVATVAGSDEYLGRFTDAGGGLRADTDYAYRVRATIAARGAASDWSNESGARTLKIARPTSPVAHAVSTSEVNLTWSESVEGDDGFVIEMSDDDSTVADADATFAFLANVPSNARHFSATGLAAKTRYRFRIATLKSSGQSDWSDITSAMTRTPPDEDADDDGEPDPQPDDEGWWEPVTSVTPGISSWNYKSFGNLAAGTYRVVYEQGVISYEHGKRGQWGGSHANGGYHLITGPVAHGQTWPNHPGMGGPLANTAAEVLARQGTSVGLGAHPGGEVSVVFWDYPYTDNVGEGMTFRLDRYHPPQPPEPPPEDDPDTDDIDEGPSTISLSVKSGHTVATEGGTDHIELVFSRGTGQPGKKRPAVTVEYTLAGTATPQADYTGPAGGAGFAGVYKVTIPADSGSTDPLIEPTDGVSATVKLSAKADDAFEDDETAVASLRATGTYRMGNITANGSIAQLGFMMVVGFEAFIPMTLPGSPSTTGWFPQPVGDEWEFAGNMRTFGQLGTAKLRSQITIDTRKIGSMTNVVGTAFADASHRRLILTPATSLESMTAQVSHSEVVQQNGLTPDGNKATQLHATAEAAYPFQWFAPSIDFDVQFQVEVLGHNTVKVELIGSHDEFPAYEAWVAPPSGGRKYFYSYTPTSSGPGVYNLNSPETIWTAGQSVPSVTVSSYTGQ